MKWLAEDLAAEVKSFDQVGRDFDFSGYELVIVSSGTYCGLMPLNRFLKKFWKKLEVMKVIAVAVGAAAADDSWSVKSYKRIPEKIRSKIEYVKLIGEMPNAAKAANYQSPVKRENLGVVLEKIKG